MATSLVMGASGFLGSHVTRQLVERGDEVRVWVRPTSSTRAFDQLQVRRHVGELSDDSALREAMRDVDTVYYCIVDTRAWLRDPALAAEHLVLDACRERGLPAIVMCVSTTYGAPDYGSPHGRMVSERHAESCRSISVGRRWRWSGSRTRPGHSCSPPNVAGWASATSSASAT